MSELEDKLRALDIWQEDDDGEYDIDDTIAFVEDHPELNEEFETITDLLSSCWEDIDEDDVLDKESTNELIEKLTQLIALIGTSSESQLITTMDFFATVGGAKLTWKLYEKALDTLNQSCVSEMAIVLKENDKPEVKTAKKLLKRLRRIWVNATDQSAAFAVCLGRAGVVSKLAEEMDFMYKEKGMSTARRDAFLTSLTIAHNCAQCEDLRWEFRETMTSGDKPFLQIVSEMVSSDDLEIRLSALLTLSYLIDDDEADILAADEEFDFLLDKIETARDSENHRDAYGYKLLELLHGLRNLTNNDENKRLLMEKDVLERVLFPTLENGDQEEKAAACAILWGLAWNEDNKREMKKNAALLKMIEDLTEDQDEDVAGNASGIQFVLNMCGDDGSASQDDEEDEDAEESVPEQATPVPARAKSARPTTAASQSTEGGHIMMSYSHKNKETVRKIVAQLRERSYDVWFDEDHMKGHLLDAMSEAVENSAVFLMCTSQSYKESPDCRTEATYAREEGKLIIPLKMEKDFKPKGWLGLLQSDKKWFDFSGKYPFEDKFEELVKDLGSKGKK